MLIAAARPFRVQPYAETRPIFLHAEDCASCDGAGIQPIAISPEQLLKVHRADHRIA